MLSKKQFDRLRLALIDRLRRDGSKRPATRVVCAEIIAHTNYVTGDAWTGGQYLAKKLGLCIRTVRRSITEATVNDGALDNYLHVTHSGRSNRYRPNFALVGQTQLPLEQAASAQPAIGDKNDSNRGHFCTRIGDKNVPLSLIENPNTSPQRAASSNSARLREGRGDEKAEVEAARLLGEDGYSILSRLHEIDQGQPRLRLLSLIRGGRCTERDLVAARLAAWTAPSMRKGKA